MGTVQPITVAEVKDSAQHDAITTIKLVNTSHGFVMVVGLNWKSGEWVLQAPRNKTIRYWRTLDSCVARIKTWVPDRNLVTLFLKEDASYEA